MKMTAHLTSRGNVLVAGLAFAGFVSAATIPWTGGAGNGDWSDGANWEGETVPAATDTAFFQTEATVTPPPESFVGTVAVSNATVVVEVAGESAFSSAVHPGAKLVKSGTGTLTLRAAPGAYSGEISVLAGTVRFAGNGDDAAPGMFGRLTVAAGATATVVESPVETRHGALSIAVDRAGASTTLSALVARAGTFPDFESAWNGIEVTNDNQKVVFLPSDESPYLRDNLWMPSFWQGRNFFTVYSRALFVVPQTGRVHLWQRADDYSITYVDGVKCFALDNSTALSFSSLSAGWHALDTVLEENSGSELVTMSISGAMYPGTTRFIPDVLWKGVCFTDLVLPEEATLTVEAGQAVAFVLGAATDVKGTIDVGEAARFTIAGGTLSASVDCFGASAGLIEVARFGGLALSGLSAETALKVEGTGCVPFDLVPLLAPDFNGTIEVPEGTTYTNTLSAGVSFVGSGTLVTPGLAGTESFAGPVVVSGEDACADELEDSKTDAASWTLADGAALTVGGRALFARTFLDLDDWNTEGAWALRGRSLKNESGVFTGNPAYVTNGVLVITDDGGSQRNTAVLTNRLFTVNDDCEISFVYANEMLQRFSNEARAEGMSCYFTKKADAGNPTEGLAYATDGYGFTLYQYRSSGTMGFTWVINGNRATSPDFTESQMGLDLTKPMQVKVRLRTGICTVTFVQNGKTFTATHDFTNGFGATDKRFFGVGGGTGYWGEPPTTADVYCYQTLSNFVGRVYGQGTDINNDRYLPVSSETWRLKETGVVLTNDTELLFAWKAKEGTASSCDGFAVCRQTLPVRQAFTLTFNERLDKEVSGWAEGLSVFFTPDGDSVANGSYRYYPNLSRNVAFVHYYWNNQFGWSHNGANVANDKSESNPGGIPKSTGVNAIQIDYDGAGTFTATVKRGDAIWTSTRTYSDVLSWGDTMSFGFMGGTSTWGAYLQTRVTDVNLGFGFNDYLMGFVPALNVEPDATATFKAGNLEPESNSPSIAFETSVLGANSTLNVVGETANGTRLALRDVTVSGDAAVAVDENSVLELADIRSEGTLTVTGPWIGSPVFHVDVARIGSDRVLAILDPELYKGEGEPVFSALGLDGVPVSNRYRLSYKKGVVRLAVAGFVVFIR